jgi:glucose/arabinose dehydrogenase
MKKMAHLVAAAFAALLVCGLVQPVRPAAAQTPSLQGTYALDPSTSPNVAQAIQNVTSQMGFFKQGIAQKRLTATNVPAQTLVITQTASDIAIQADGGQAIKTPLNGTPVTVTRDDGSQVQVATVWQGSTLQRSFTAQDGVRTNSYSLSGNTLTESVQVTSPELPQPLTYQLVYHKGG